MTRSDLNIGERLAIGFGLLFTVLAVMLAIFFGWHRNSVRAQTEYAAQIAPLRDQMSALERSAYRVAIQMRSVLLVPEAARIMAFAGNVELMRSHLNTLQSMTMEPEARELLSRIEITARTYIADAEQLVERRRSSPVNLEEEAAVGQLRLALLELTGQFVELQEQEGTLALERIAVASARISRGLLVMALVTVLLCGVLAVLTARSVSRPAQRLVRIADALRAGDWKPALSLAPKSSGIAEALPRNEMRRLSAAIGSAARALETREQRLRIDRELARTIASTLQREELAERALGNVMAHLGGAVGVVYGVVDDAMLHPIARYALGDEVQPLRFGEGIPGQAARDRQSIVVIDPPPQNTIRIRLGYDEPAPRALVAVPLLFRDTLHGVLLVGTLHDLTDDARAFLEASATQLGIGLQNVAAYEHVQTLLTDVSERNEKIQAQNEELQVQNEEIQAQNEEIQAQSQQLQVQQEEMQAQNEELLQQSEELRRHATALADADDRKNKFLGVLAHELRNPMAPIANSIVILKRAEAGSEAAQRAQTIIERQTTHLVRLIDDLLDITRITEGKIHIRREPLDLVDVVRTCVEDVGSAFEDANIALALDVPAGPVAIAGDRTRLCQVLGNLLNNSLKFCNAGGQVQLVLRAEDAGGTAVMHIIDDGIGMDADLLGRLFQPFNQGISGLARTNGGLGLGLALVRALVSLHDGVVEAFSEGPGRGAMFTVRIPLATADLATDGAEAATPGEASGLPIYRMLIIEDNIDAAHSLRDALRLDRHEIALAHSGAEGLALAKTFRPDVVLCDVGLPDMDGYEVARALRADPTLRSVLLVALTGYASTPDKQDAYSAGFDLHLAKPLPVDRLPQILAELRGS